MTKKLTSCSHHCRNTAFQLIYFAFESSGTTIDSRRVKTIDYTAAVTDAKIAGPRGDYSVATVTGAMRRLTLSLSMFVEGAVATEQNEMFRAALQLYWNETVEGE